MNSAQFIKTSVKRLTRGFTMIELLIVITILGVLAVAVLSAINPIEQINRGRDTGSQSDAEQLISAVERYQATQELWPWQGTSLSADNQAWMKVTTSTWKDSAATPVSVLGKLTGATEEVKVSFQNRLDAAKAPLYVYRGAAAGDSMYVCFEGKSNAFRTKAATRCVDAAGSGLPADLVSQAAAVCGVGHEYTCLP